MQYGESGRVDESAIRGGERVAGDEAELVEPAAQVVEHVELHQTLERHQVVAAARALLDARLERRQRSAQFAFRGRNLATPKYSITTRIGTSITMLIRVHFEVDLLPASNTPITIVIGFTCIKLILQLNE